MEKSVVITIQNLNKSFKVYRDKATTLKERLLFSHRNKSEMHHVLKDINLEIYKGETVALIGTNGSGKSTLLKLLSQIIYPEEGKINIEGKMASLLELGAGFHPDFSGRENIYFNAAIFGFTRQETDSKIQDIIDFSELGEFIDVPVRTYSSGMYMRLAFSIAINVDADIMLFDEVLAVGDEHFRKKCLDRISQMCSNNTTSILVTHDMNAVRSICNRVVWLRDGQIHMDGIVEDIVKSYQKVTI